MEMDEESITIIRKTETYLSIKLMAPKFSYRQLARVPNLSNKNPNFLWEAYSGYQNRQDPTVQSQNTLAAGSYNGSVPSKDMFVPDLGKMLLAQVFTENVGINGNRTKYTNLAGIEIEVRNWFSGDARNDVVEVLFTNESTGTTLFQQITENSNPLPTGVHRFKYTEWFDTSLDGTSLNINRLIWVNGLTKIFSWTGGIATIGTVTGTTIATFSGNTWGSYGFIQGSNIVVNGLAYTITSGWDTNILTMASTAGISTNQVASSQIRMDSATQNLTISFTSISGVFQINETVTGGTSGATGEISYLKTTTPATLTVVPTNGINFLVGETITGGVSNATGTILDTNTGTIALDYCDTCKNYVLYGSWKLKQLFISNNFNRNTSQLITSANAIQNDLIIANSSSYTGLGSHTIVVTIDSVTPAKDTQTFNGTGINDGSFDTSTYSGMGNNDYKVLCVANYDFTFTGAPTIVPSPGDILQGSISGAIGRVAFLDSGGQDPVLVLLSSQGFQVGDTVTGSRGSYGTVATATSQDWFQYFKNGIALLPQGYTAFIAYAITTSPQTVIFGDNLSITFQNSTGHNPGDYYELTIQTEQPDTFSYSVDGGAVIANHVPIAQATAQITHGAITGTFLTGERVTGTSGATGFYQSDTGTVITLSNVTGIFQIGDILTGQTSGATTTATAVTQTGSSQNLLYGVVIQFTSNTGHTLGDTWTIIVRQAISNAWANFYFTLPDRIPGEGYITTLPSNFWTMGQQENVEYINMQNGTWVYFETTVTTGSTTTTGTDTADQTISGISVPTATETISIQPLKQATFNKVIDPWLIGYMEDDLVYVTTSKTLDMIGRKQFLELPQIGSLSYWVQNDFDKASFVGGSIVYLDKKLNITSPAESVMFQYDNHKDCEYWNPPKTFSENGILSIVGANLITHSNLRNQTFTLFASTNGDNGQSYTVSMQTPYSSQENRWQSKNSSMSFTEGYITGNPILTHTAILGVGGCGGIYDHVIQPIVCVIPDRSPFGEGSFGSHSFGSDNSTQGSHFQEIYERYAPILDWYFLATNISCTALNHTWKILSTGYNSIDSTTGNNNLVTKQSVLP